MFKRLEGCEIKATLTILKTDKFVYYSKATLDVKFCLIKSLKTV